MQVSKSILDWRPNKQASHGEEPPTVNTTRIMIVDDDEDIRRVLNVIVEAEGYEVIGLVDDGMNAVDLAMEHQPDIVILDYMMPNLDGAETAKFLRAVSPNTKVVAFSGIVTEPPKWADAFLRKEGMGEVVDLIRSLVGDA